MAGETDFKDAEAMLNGAREARLQMVVFHHDAQVPGEVASLSRLLWRHIPELAKRSGVQIDEKEGHPPEVSASDRWLAKTIADDMSDGRGVVDWLAKVTSDQTKAMFAKGRDNAMDGILQRFSEERGFERNDLIAVEAGRIQPEPVQQERSRQPAAAFAAHMAAQRGR